MLPAAVTSMTRNSSAIRPFEIAQTGRKACCAGNPKLHRCIFGGKVELTDGAVTTINRAQVDKLSSVREISGQFGVASSGVDQLALDGLEKVGVNGGLVDVSNNSSLTSMSLQGLTRVDGNFTIADNSNLGTLTVFPAPTCDDQNEPDQDAGTNNPCAIVRGELRILSNGALDTAFAIAACNRVVAAASINENANDPGDGGEPTSCPAN